MPIGSLSVKLPEGPGQALPGQVPLRVGQPCDDRMIDRDWILRTRAMLDPMSLPQMDLMAKSTEKMHYKKSLKKYTDEEIKAEYERRFNLDK